MKPARPPTRAENEAAERAADSRARYALALAATVADADRSTPIQKNEARAMIERYAAAATTDAERAGWCGMLAAMDRHRARLGY